MCRNLFEIMHSLEVGMEYLPYAYLTQSFLKRGIAF